MVPTYLLPIFGNDTFPAKHIPKSGLGGIPNLGPFPPPPNHTLCFSSTVGLASPALAELQDDEPPALLRLSLLLVWLFSLSCMTLSNFCHYGLALFHCVCLVEFGVHPYHFLLHLCKMGLTSILLYKRIWAFIRQIFFIGSKGSWNQFALVYQSHSVEEICIL